MIALVGRQSLGTVLRSCALVQRRAKAHGGCSDSVLSCLADSWYTNRLSGSGTVLASTAAVAPAAYEHDAGLGRSTTSDSGFVDRDSHLFTPPRPTLNGAF